MDKELSRWEQKMHDKYDASFILISCLYDQYEDVKKVEHILKMIHGDPDSQYADDHKP